MVVLLQKLFDSVLLFKKHCIQISATVFLLSTLFASGSLAKEETRYIKGLGAVLREKPSIHSKTITKLSRGEKVLAMETKGIWHKVDAGKNQGWVLRGQVTNFPVKIKRFVYLLQ